MSIYPNGDAVATSTVRGRTLAHQSWNQRRRAFAAADLVTGRVAFAEPTVLQAAALCKVSQPYVAAALKVADRVTRAQIVSGHLPLIEARPPVPKMLARPTPLLAAWASGVTRRARCAGDRRRCRCGLGRLYSTRALTLTKTTRRHQRDGGGRFDRTAAAV
jgi:hypothetical protein